ncbi:MAG: hypothetical protein P4L64_11550 [Caulobacteraceae bacterium]|nr:hypothetical protein [Caulobacteraceae bacterium]
MILAMALAAPAPVELAALRLRPVATIVGQDLTLGAVADLSPLPASLRGAVAGLALARFRPGQTRMVLSAARLTARAQALAPGLRPWLKTQDGDVTVSRATEAAPSLSSGFAGRCVRVLRPLEPRAVATADDLEAAPCAAKAAGTGLVYDRELGAVRAARRLDPGERLAAPAAFALAEVRPGQRLSIQTRVGPVAVIRTVEALQPAQPGQALFVRAGDAVFSATLAEARP